LDYYTPVCKRCQQKEQSSEKKVMEKIFRFAVEILAIQKSAFLAYNCSIKYQEEMQNVNI
jgi:hypothetical protein